VAAAAPHGLEPAEADLTSSRARRRTCHPLGQAPLAGAKKGARQRRAWIVFEDESGFSLTPPLRATWAPRGRTPVVRHRFNWKRMSATIALCYRSDGQRARLYFHTRPGTYNDIGLIEFLEQLRRHFRGEQVLLLWDGLPSHRSGRMRAYLARQHRWLCQPDGRRLRNRAHTSVSVRASWPTSHLECRRTTQTWPSQRPRRHASPPDTGSHCSTAC
jgi:DDE superfamily endonuclease